MLIRAERVMVRVHKLKLVFGGLIAAVMLAGPVAEARQAAVGAEVAGVVALAELPPQGHQTWERIRSGGPFPYEKDGVVFANRERLLPLHKRGYYREYTVPTPGLRARGVRRIVCGGLPRSPDVCYYSADHYASFRRIVP